MKKSLLSIAGALVGIGLADPLEAASLIGVNYMPTTAVAMTSDEVAGAPGVRTWNWNNAGVLGANTTFDLPDGTIYDNQFALVNGLSISLFTGNAGNPSTRGNPPGGTAPALVNDGRMFRNVTDKFDGAEGSITITGIPYAKYHLYFYAYPDAGSGGERGGYFTVTNSLGEATTRWLKGGTGANSTIALPNPNTGDGYIESKTATQPTNFAGIEAGHFVMLPNLTDPNIVVYYSAVGAGAGGVSGGDSVRRLKFSGFQIVEVTSATLTGLFLAAPIPQLYSGNPQGYVVTLVGNYSDGSIAPLGTDAVVAYGSSDTNVFTVTTAGHIQPRAIGTANLEASYQSLSLTQEVSVVGPVAIRPVLQVDPLYLGARNLQVTLFADFPDGAFDVNATAFTGVTFTGGPPSVVTVSAKGLLTTVGEGEFNLGASYAGVTGQTEPAGTVLPYEPPQPDSGKVALSFNIQSGQAMAFNHLAGAPGVRVGYWNNVAGLLGSRNTVTLGPDSIQDSAGRFYDGLTASVTGGNGQPSTRGTQSGDESTMFNGVYDQFDGIPGTIQITGLPFASYDAYFYAISGDTDNSRPGHFTIGDQTRWILNTRAVTIPFNDGSGYVESVTTNAPLDVVEMQTGNYVRFPNLTGRDLHVEFLADGASAISGADPTAPRLKFSGFQLVGEVAPLLKVTRTDATQLSISWPAWATGYVLKSNTVINGTWNSVNATPASDGNNFSVSLPTSGSAAYFILHKP